MSLTIVNTHQRLAVWLIHMSPIAWIIAPAWIILGFTIYHVYSKSRAITTEDEILVLDEQKLQDSDRYVLLLKDNTRPQRDIRVAFGNSPLGPWKNISKPFTDKLTEGPTALKIDGNWLIYYDAYGNKTYKAAKTSDFKSFTDVTDLMTFPSGLKHGTAFVATRQELNYLLKVGKKKTQ